MWGKTEERGKMLEPTCVSLKYCSSCCRRNFANFSVKLASDGDEEDDVSVVEEFGAVEALIFQRLYLLPKKNNVNNNLV